MVLLTYETKVLIEVHADESKCQYQKGRGAIVNRMCQGMLLFAGILVLGATTIAQSTQIIVRAVDGRNGKPLANQHLLVFAGKSPDGVREQETHFDLMTDKDGLTTLTITSPEIKWIQVWPDGQVLCQTGPNSTSFSVGEIMSTGLKTPNTCSSLVREVAPGHLVVFARPATFAEKMRR